jgi:hypothetical protein
MPVVHTVQQKSLARVTRVTIRETERHRDHAQQEFVAYVVCCTGEGEPWKISKRFSDFTALRERLAARGLAQLAREQFPSKVLFGRRDDSVVEKRKSALERVRSFACVPATNPCLVFRIVMLRNERATLIVRWLACRCAVDEQTAGLDTRRLRAAAVPAEQWQLALSAIKRPR